MNLLEQKEQVESLIVERAKHIFYLATGVDEKLFDGESIPYLSTCYGVSFSLNYWEQEHLCDTWDEENKQWLSKYTKHCSLHVNENPDPYEDYGTTSWSVELPVEIVTQGTDQSIEDFFIDYFTKDKERRTKIKNRDLYLSLFNMEKHIVSNFLQNKKSFREDLDHKDKEEILRSIGVNI